MSKNKSIRTVGPRPSPAVIIISLVTLAVVACMGATGTDPLTALWKVGEFCVATVIVVACVPLLIVLMGAGDVLAGLGRHIFRDHDHDGRRG